MSIAIEQSTSEPIAAKPEQPATKPQAHSRRTLDRLALALVGLAGGLAGQYFFSQGSLWDGLLFYGLAVIFFARALAGRYAVRPSSVSSGPLSTDQFPLPTYPLPVYRRNFGVWLMLLALGASVLTYNFFGNEQARTQAWWLYLVSLLVFVGGVLLFTRGTSGRMDLYRLVPGQPIALALGGVVVVALLMRLYNFSDLPFGIWFDEAEAGLQARRMLQQSSYRPVLYAPINITGHLLVLYALALHWLGDAITSMRLVSVAFGLGGVLAAYLFGRELRGPRFGLALAFLVAVARWHVNFSRVAMTGIDTPFFEFLTLFFLTRWLRRKNPRDAMWAGFSLGFGLTFYTAFRLFIVALIIFAVIAAFIWWDWVYGLTRQGRWKNYLGHLGLMIAASWLVVTPLVQFALAEPDAFWYRTRQISIFTRRDQADVSQALWATTTKHLLMFNFAGDNNGRHNLPGAPMLDPVTAALFVLGLGLALVQLRSRRYSLAPAHLFFALLLPLSLAGGIFSVDFEAPQSLRSIAVMPAVFYFSTVALAALGREAESALKPLSLLWTLGPAAGLAGVVLAFNAYTYFVSQATDFASWNAFSTPETIVGREMTKLGSGPRYYLSPFFADHPSIQFLAPRVINQQPLLLPDALPIRQPANRPAVLFIHPDDVTVFQEAQKLYPNAGFEIANSQSVDKRPVVYMVNLQPADIAAVQGLDLKYWPAGAKTEDEPPLRAERAPVIDLTWPQAAPAAANFGAEWQGVLYAPVYGAYHLRLLTPAAGQLEIDGHPVFEGEGEQFTTLVLAQGNHAFRLWAGSGLGRVALLWQPPGEPETLVPQWALYAPPLANHGLLGTFYANPDWQGEPVLQRIEPMLDTYFHLVPLPRPYSVEWRGWLDAPQTGVYQLGLRAVPEAELYLDGVQLIATTLPNEMFETTTTLEAGLHDLVVRYRDTVDRSRIHLYWMPPGGQFEPIPGLYLWPPMERPPESISTQVPQSEIDVQSLALRWLATLGGPGSEPGQFLEPRDVVVLNNGNLVIADTGNRRVQILDAQGSPLWTLTGDDLPFEEPLAVAVNSLDEILVLESTLQWIYRYDAEGNFIDRFGGPAAHLFHPRGLTVFEDGTVVVADTGGARLVFFNADGSLQGQLGSFGAGPGQFIEPTDVARDAQQTYFVVEAETDRIQRIDPAGNALGQWSIPPTYAFNGPHLAFGPDGSLFATEVQSQSLLRYAPDGRLLNQWRTIDGVSFVGPVGIYFDDVARRLYVTDVQTHQVYMFEIVETE